MTSGILHHVVASITETLPSAIELLTIKAGMGRLLEMKVGSEAFEIDQGNCGCGQGNHAEIELCRGGCVSFGQAERLMVRQRDRLFACSPAETM